MRTYKISVNGLLGRGFARPRPVKSQLHVLKARRDVLIRTIAPYVAISGTVPGWASGSLRRINGRIRELTVRGGRG